jgi:2-oxoglutarate ferredoxin oxidoreductase subunit alpha
MTDLRQQKIDNIAKVIPPLQLSGNRSAELLVVGWGGTYGHLYSAVRQFNEQGRQAALAHFNYINPLPANTEEVLNGFKKIVVCELNSGQFASHLRSKLKLKGEILQYNKVQGQPFTVEELLRHFSTIL